MTNRNISESLAQLAEIPPASTGASTVLSGAFQLNKSRKAMATVLLGTPGAGGTVDAKFQWSATAAGTYADVAGSNITQLTAAGTAQTELRADRALALGCGPYFKLAVIVAVATCPIAAIVQGADGRYEPHSDNNDASVLAAATLV